MSRADLDRQMRLVLAKLELVSNGTTVSYNAGGGGGDNPDPRPRGGIAPPHIYWARAYGKPFMAPTGKHCGAADDVAREQIVADANEDHRRLTGHGLAATERPQGETVDQRNRRICDEGEGYSLKEAAIKFRCGERDVRKARIAEGLDPTRGKAPIGSLPADERRKRAVELRGQSHSVAAIALLLKVSKTTVKRDLRINEAA